MALHDHTLLGRVSAGYMEIGGKLLYIYMRQGRDSIYLYTCPGTLQFGSNATWTSDGMVAGAARH